MARRRVAAPFAMGEDVREYSDPENLKAMLQLSNLQSLADQQVNPPLTDLRGVGQKNNDVANIPADLNVEDIRKNPVVNRGYIENLKYLKDLALSAGGYTKPQNEEIPYPSQPMDDEAAKTRGFLKGTSKVKSLLQDDEAANVRGLLKGTSKVRSLLPEGSVVPPPAIPEDSQINGLANLNAFLGKDVNQAAEDQNKVYGEQNPQQVIPEAKFSQGTKLSDEDEAKFQNWARSLPWYKEFTQLEGGEPDLNDPNYDYRLAFLKGIEPKPYQYDNNRYHWPSMTTEGEPLKGENHPTKWKEDVQRELGVNPDAVGMTEEEGLRQLQAKQVPGRERMATDESKIVPMNQPITPQHVEDMAGEASPISGAVEKAKNDPTIQKDLMQLSGNSTPITPELMDNASAFEKALTQRMDTLNAREKELLQKVETGNLTTMDKLAIGLAVAIPILIGLRYGAGAAMGAVGKGLEAYATGTQKQQEIDTENNAKKLENLDKLQKERIGLQKEARDFSVAAEEQQHNRNLYPTQESQAKQNLATSQAEEKQSEKMRPVQLKQAEQNFTTSQAEETQNEKMRPVQLKQATQNLATSQAEEAQNEKMRPLKQEELTLANVKAKAEATKKSTYETFVDNSGIVMIDGKKAIDCHDETGALMLDYAQVAPTEEGVKRAIGIMNDAKDNIGIYKHANIKLNETEEILQALKDKGLYDVVKTYAKWISGLSGGAIPVDRPMIDVIDSSGNVTKIDALAVLQQDFMFLQDFYNKQIQNKKGGLTGTLERHWKNIISDPNDLSTFATKDFPVFLGQVRALRDSMNERVVEDLTGQGFMRKPLEENFPSNKYKVLPTEKDVNDLLRNQNMKSLITD